MRQVALSKAVEPGAVQSRTPPMASAWSVIAAKSRGRPMRTGRVPRSGIERRESARLSAGEGVGVLGAEAGVEHVGVHRVGRVDMEVAPEHGLLRVVVVASLRFGRARRQGRQREQGG